MGKTAKNEQIKLNATFLNNLAVGLCLAGFLVPLLTLSGEDKFFFDQLDRVARGDTKNEFQAKLFMYRPLFSAGFAILGGIASIVVAGVLKFLAHRVASTLED